VVALTYRATVDVPARFRKSKSVGAVFGLTCSKYQSGEIDRSGRISRCGDEVMRVMLYEAAQSMLRSKKWSWLKSWATQVARRCGMKKAIVALARRLAVIMHRICQGHRGCGRAGPKFILRLPHTICMRRPCHDGKSFMADPKRREVAESVFNRNQRREAEINEALRQSAARRAAVVKNMHRLRAQRLERDKKTKAK
jgi:hypothetical protein